MKTLISARLTGVLALLCSSVVTAATVTMTPSTGAPNPTDTFTVSLAGSAFTNDVGGITLDLQWDPAVVSFVGAVLPDAGPLAAATGTILQVNTGPGPVLQIINILPGTMIPTAAFDIATVTFTAVAGGNANIVFDDDAGLTSGFFDNNTADHIPVDYVQATVVVTGGVAGPEIVVTDSVAPADDLAVDFGSVQLGSNASQTVTVTNSGTTDLVIGVIAPVAPYSFTSDMCSSQTLAATESCVITVQFTPVLAQAYPADLTIPSNDADEATVIVALTGTGTDLAAPDITVTDTVAPIDDLLVGFGDVTVSTSLVRTITVANDGSADLVLGTLGTPLAPFSTANDTCSTLTLAPASSCTIDVVFSPVAAGAASGSLDIPSNDADEATVSVALSGNGTPASGPIASVTDSAAPANDNLIPFGDVTIGGTSPAQTVTVTNSGTEDLVIGAIAGANALEAPFFIGTDACSNSTLTPTDTCNFEVTFQPAALGADTDGFDIPSNAAGSPITFNVNGTGVPVPVADITVTDSVAPTDDLIVAFGNVALAATENQTITVTNDGSEDLVIGTVVAPAAPFTIPTDLCSAQTLAPTDTCTITVAFTPDLAQPYNGSVSIPSDDPDEATVVIALSGTGSDGVIVIDGGSSAVDPWGLALLGGLAFLRRRRKAAAMKLAMVAAAGVLAAPAAMAADGEWDWDYDGIYIGVGGIGTSLETSDDFSSALDDVLGIETSGHFEDFPIGGQVYLGWMFNRNFGIEGRWSDSADGESDIIFVENDGTRTNIGEIEASIDGWTAYFVGNIPVAQRWDLFAKAGYTDQDISVDITSTDASGSASDDDSGFAGALGARYRFARHWATTVEGEYLGVDFDGAIDDPWRVGLNVEYWFGGHEIPPPAAPPPPPPARAAVVPPPPPPPAPKDADGDGVVDAQDECADTPKGDRVGTNGCSCDVTRQLTFKTDSAELSSDDIAVLDEMAENLTRLKFISGVIEGHTDSTGAEDYNQDLSERRAQSAYNHLVSKGISGDRLQIVGLGESQPIGDNATAEGRAQNRRVVAKRTDCDK